MGIYSIFHFYTRKLIVVLPAKNSCRLRYIQIDESVWYLSHMCLVFEKVFEYKKKSNRYLVVGRPILFKC